MLAGEKDSSKSKGSSTKIFQDFHMAFSYPQKHPVSAAVLSFPFLLET